MKTLRWCISLFALALMASCSFNTVSPQFSCETDIDCPSGRSCQMGWCVTSTVRIDAGIDADLPDADLRPDADLPDADMTPDAAPPDADLSPDASRPLTPCNSCQGLICREECTDLSCSFDCSKSGCDCEFQCDPTTTDCDLLCDSDTTCDMDCGGATNCTVTCEDTADCTIDCTGVTDCTGTSCNIGASCLLDCTSTGACAFLLCDGVETSCPNNVIACNRACP